MRLLVIELGFGAGVGAGAGLGFSELICGACSEVPPPPPPHELIKRLINIIRRAFFCYILFNSMFYKQSIK